MPGVGFAGQERENGAGALSDPARAIGRRLRGNLGAGQPLLARHLEFDYAVTQGMSVTITNEIRGIRIETAGQSLDSGQLGEPVRVANRSSGRILRAIVSGPNKVTLAPNIR
ncbi:MAG: flagella basal body P-ring formation protein FlgA [Rhodobacteraceae bacterium]|nr:flagella basal body P-ring formation protein FlgA [Paracoccaceae bacterium]